MTQGKILENRRMALLLFFLCWAIYFTSYLGKRNFSAAMAELISTGFLDKALAGFINTIFFLCYGAGQFINGILADRLSPSRMIFTGLILSATANLGMGLTTAPTPMPFLWAVNGYALSMLWAPILRLFSDLLEGQRKINFTVNLATSMAAGGLGSYLLSALMIYISGWRWAFFAAAILLFLTAAVWLCMFPLILSSACERKATETVMADTTSGNSIPLRTLLLSFSVILIAIPVIVQGMLRDGVSSWVPTYITESFAILPTFSVLVSTLLPFVTLSGPYLAYFINRKYLHNEMATSSLLFLIAAVSLGCLSLFGKNSLFGCIFFLCIITTVIEGVNVMTVSLIPLKYGHLGRTATMSGFFNFLTYVGAALSTFGTGIIAQHTGWRTVILTWFFFSCLAEVVCLLATKGASRNPIEKQASPNK